MIGRIPHPEDPDKVVFVPLRYDSEDGQWTPILPNGKTCEHAIDAGRVCFDRILPAWSALVHTCRVLRGLCEHPEFDFEADGIDTSTIRREARTLVCKLDALGVDLERLLHEPKATDCVCIAGLVMNDNPVEDITSQPPTE